MEIFHRMESQVRSYSRSFPVVFHKALGSTLYDEHGKGYLDFLAGAGTLNYGHNHPLIKQAVMDYLEEDGLIHGLDTFTCAKRDFLGALDEIILRPRQLDYRVQFPGPTGTNAVEAAMKLARLVKQRENIVAFTNGFHGVSLGSLAATANSHFRSGAGTTLNQVTFMPYCGYMGEEGETLGYFRQLLNDPSSGLDRPAAVIVETVQGEGGVNVASIRWLRELEVICREFDMLLIVDDIQVGNGRTGSFFSFEKANLRPDIVLLSKSLGALGLPLAIMLFKPELDIWKPGQHNGTFRSNNLALVAATAALENFWRSPELAQQVAARGRRLHEGLQEIADAFDGELMTIRGRGMIQGIACAQPELASEISRAAFANGMIIETAGPLGEVVKCLPPLVLTEDELERGLEILARSVATAVERLRTAEMAAKEGRA